MIPGDFDIRMRPPDGELATVVARIFFARGASPHGRERILPSPGAVLLTVLGPPLRMTPPIGGARPRDLVGAWLTGPHERPILNEPTGETHVVGVVFEAGGIAHLLDVPADALANDIVPLDDVATTLPPGDALVLELSTLEDGDDAIEAMEARLAAAVVDPGASPGWSRVIVDLVRGDRPIGELQAELGVSRRYFTEQIRARVGLTPKSLQRIARMRRMLDEIDARRPIRWSVEAVGAGYFDQPHAIREFKTFTGLTPTEYVERRRAAWGGDVEPGEATNFVPELIR